MTISKSLLEKEDKLKRRLLEVGQTYRAVAIDGCVWNFRTKLMCQQDFECSQVRVHQEPMSVEFGHCLKLRYHRMIPPKTVMLQVDKSKFIQQPLHPTSHKELRAEEEKTFGNAPSARLYGFYFPVSNRWQGVVEVLKSVRRFYPEEPIYVQQDGGKVNFGQLCKLERPDVSKHVKMSRSRLC